ncbi:PREDICTED: zinc finger protein 318-like [Condylura cristata]|uniref:zinc finger protein 318-like n=1 Tax=Condylura cristata TaxID=143302 RepID=UPI0006435BED|nr:PREDICTED: zinc finger protein 318-like [Condylura cristata]
MPQSKRGVPDACSSAPTATRCRQGKDRSRAEEKREYDMRGSRADTGPWRPWRPWCGLRRRPMGERPRRPRGASAAEATDGGDTYQLEHRRRDPSSDCSNRPEPRRGSRRPRRSRSRAGYRGRRASSARPRACRVVRSLSPPWAAFDFWPPPSRRRLYPPPPGRAGFRGRRRGVSRGDFARYLCGDIPGDLGSEICSPGLHSDSLKQSLRVPVGNVHFAIPMPKYQRLSEQLGSPVNNLEPVDRDDVTDDSVFTRSSQCSRGLERYISQEEGPLSPFLGQLDEDYRTRAAFMHHSDYRAHMSCHNELLRGAERNRDKLKGSYCVRPEERSREAKRPRYDDTEKIHGKGDDHSSYSSAMRNYRQRRRSPSPRFLDPEFRELDLARRKQEEEEERSRSLSQELVEVDGGGTSCPIPGLSGVLPASEPAFSLHRPEEGSVMPKKSIPEKRIKLESFSSSTSSSQRHPLHSGHPSFPLCGAIASETVNDSHVRENFANFLCHKEKSEVKVMETEQLTDFLLPHERAVQDGSGFSRILSILAESASPSKKRRLSFSDIEDEEKFLYGDEETRKAESSSSLPSVESEVIMQSASCLPYSAPTVKLEPLGETNPRYAKFLELVQTLGLDFVSAEISKLATYTQEQFHRYVDESSENLNLQTCDMQLPKLNQSPAMCYYCKTPGHWKRDCIKLKRLILYQNLSQFLQCPPKSQ